MRNLPVFFLYTLNLVAEILKVKSQMDSGMFKALQLAAIEALAQDADWFGALNAEYKKRRTAAGSIFDALGVEYDPDIAGLFLWGRVPAKPVVDLRGSSLSRGEALSEKLLWEAGVFITPGCVFGKNGDDYVRISLCASVPVLEEALARVRVFIDECNSL